MSSYGVIGVDGWMEDNSTQPNNVIKTRVLDTESRQMKEALQRERLTRHNSLLANGLPLSFLVYFFFQISLYSLDFLSSLHITLLSHLCLHYNPLLVFFFLPLISPSPLSVIGMGLCARIHLIKRTRRTHNAPTPFSHTLLCPVVKQIVCARIESQAISRRIRFIWRMWE